MKQFNKLSVTHIEREAKDAIRIGLHVPESLIREYNFLPGQHLPFQIELDGGKIRRTYSICSGIDATPMEIGVRVQSGGTFSEYAAATLQVGDTLDAMPPSGQFHISLQPEKPRDCVGFAAGSGITPILSMMKSILAHEPASRFILFYGNRKQSTTMFIEDLYALKNRYPERVQLNFVFSQEEQDFDAMAGRLDGDKVRELYRHFGAGLRTTDAFVCGPDSMIEEVTAALIELGMQPDNVHSERFGVPRRSVAAKVTAAIADETMTTVTVIMDGHKQSFEMARDGRNFVDAAADNGLDLPYSCKGGVCATCRCHVKSGRIEMGTNYGLEPWEVEKGFVLACQSVPLGDAVVLDYDKS